MDLNYEPVRVEIKNWGEYNPRKDIKRPHWFALNNRILEDDDFCYLTAVEKLAWIYILCKASQKNSSTTEIYPTRAETVAGISAQSVRSALAKLSERGVVKILDVRTEPVQIRTDHVQVRTSTEQNTTVQDIGRTSAIASAPPTPMIELIYQEYPKRKNSRKAKGIARLKADVKTPEALEQAIKAAKNYHRYCRDKRLEPAFIKQFATWASEWHEWVNPEADEKFERQSTFCGIATEPVVDPNFMRGFASEL